MEATVQSQLVGSEIHGFKTMQDLDVRAMFEEAKTRWLRPNEIHAILCNHKHFNILVKPLNLPKSGTIVLFDRKMLRNFRRDGHNWKKKKDGKTVKEAHEHLKVGNDERIHVYYAHGDDQSTFVRRCYWLLDKKLEHIVLVHYRDTQELFEPIMQLQGSPTIESNSSSDPPTSWNLSEDNDVDQIYYAEPNETIINHEMRLREINTLEWDELVVPPDSNKLITTEGGNMSNVGQVDQYGLNGFVDTINGSNLQNITTFEHILSTDGQSANFQLGPKLVNTRNNILDDELKSQDSFGRWMNYTMTEYPVIVDPVSTPEPLVSVTSGYSNQLQKMFTITEVSPSWASTSEDTKILIVGLFHEDHLHLSNSKLFCVCGDISVPIEVVQSGVFRCYVSPRTPGIVNLFISQDGQKPISQLISFEYRAPPIQSLSISSEEKSDWEDFHVKMRLAHLLFSTSRSLNILSSKVPPKTLKEAKIFAHKTRSIVESWDLLINSITEKKISFSRAKTSLLELTLQNRLLEWLLERILEGNKIPERDDEGQGVIHLCAILDYTWAIFPYSSSGLSIDFRDKFGWTALHWAAHNGRQRSVASLLSAGANPNLVTDPTSENPGGCTPADLASKSGYEGLAAFLAEKALLAHFEAMTLAGNVSSSLQCTIPTDDRITNGSGTNVTEEEQYLKDTLAAYRRAADAAARIQAAFREQSFKMKAKAAEFANAEDEARCIIAAMKIQHAYRKYETKKQMKAAVHIQHRFRTWKIRKDFLNKRRQVIKIQAYFRGFQVRRQYKKIIWSVGVLEKAIIRWRLRRKGLRGLQVAPNNDDSEENEKEEKVGEENFFHASRKQAEERVERSVIRVQAMFRSKKAQEEYRKMKIALNESSLEYEELFNPVTNMER